MGSRWTNEKDEKLRIALYGTEINMIEDVGPSSLRERGRNKGKLNSSLLVFFFLCALLCRTCTWLQKVQNQLC